MLIEERAGVVTYVPLEGFAPGQEGKQFTADAKLFTKTPTTALVGTKEGK